MVVRHASFFRLIGFLFDLLLLPVRLLARRRAVSAGTFLTLTIDGAVTDLVAKPRCWEFRKAKTISLYDVRELVDHAVADPRVRGLLISLTSLGAGMATSCE